MGAQGKIDWDSVEAWQKLVSAIVATGVKLDIRSVATHYGTTYDTLENRLRKVKKDAVVLKEEVANGTRGEVSPRKPAATTSKKAKTPKKTGGVLENVANSRVSKPSPTKNSASKNTGVKQELLECSMNDMFDDTPISLDHGMSFTSQNLSSQDAAHSFDEDFGLAAIGMGDGF